jgi:hypothetical protein
MTESATVERLTNHSMIARFEKVVGSVGLYGIVPRTASVSHGLLWSVLSDGATDHKSVDGVVALSLLPAEFLKIARDPSFREHGRMIHDEGNAYWSGWLGFVPVMLYCGAADLTELLATGDHGTFTFFRQAATNG